MQYLIHDFFKLPLQDRLSIIEKLIASFNHTDYESELKKIIQEQIGTTQEHN